MNLAPADTKKIGPVYDLAIMMGILSSSGQVGEINPKVAFVGELSLKGDVRTVNGVLSMTLKARDMGFESIFVPYENRFEAGVIRGIDVYPVSSVREAIEHLFGENKLTPYQSEIPTASADGKSIPDFCDVKGQEGAKRALEVAAAGGHNLIMIGSPGSGKTMLAKRIPSILPAMSFDEALEVTKIYSVAGLLGEGKSLITTRPFRSPHHTVSNVSITGGGSVPRPGEISLAHRGVLFLDEFPEFRKDAIEAMRQPLEDGTFTVSRVAGSATFPSSAMLVASMNPCKCGYYGDSARECTCTPQSIHSYLGKISGPMLDRFDIHIQVSSVKFENLTSSEKGEKSSVIKERVKKAREIQLERYKNYGIYSNSQLTASMIEEFCRVDEKGNALLKDVFEKLGLSARAHSRILKVSRTIADLAGQKDILPLHIAEAIRYRSLDKKFWGAI